MGIQTWLAKAVLTTIALAGPAGAWAQSGDVARGKYLTTIGICEGCHTPRDAQDKALPGKFLAGGRRVGGLMTPNLTPDPETGLGKWSEADIVEALRNGKRPDGSAIRPPMGIFFYRHLSDGDARAIAAYLKSLPPLSNKVDRSPVTAAAPSYPRIDSVPETDRKDAKAYGRYLTETVSHCLQCHTPRKDGLPDLTRAGAGGNSYAAPGGGTVVSANLTSGNPDGMAKWTDEQVKTAITKGIRPDGGRMVDVMDFDLYAQMSPDDLGMLVGYLRTLPPVPSK
jgi:mono/diheme cytochrome c family protein